MDFLLNVLEKNEGGKYFIAFNNQCDGIYKISQYFQYFSRKITFNVLNGYFFISLEAQSSQKRKKKNVITTFFLTFFLFSQNPFFLDYTTIIILSCT